MSKHRTQICPLWIVACLFMSSIISTYLSLAQNVKDTENSREVPQKDETKEDIVNENIIEDPSVKNVLVEVTEAHDDDEDDEGSSHESFRFTPSIAPATPQVFLVSPSMEIFPQSSVQNEIEPSSSHAIPMQSATLHQNMVEGTNGKENVIEEEKVTVPNEDQDIMKKNNIHQNEDLEPLSPAMEFFPPQKSSVYSDRDETIEVSAVLQDAKPTSNPKEILNEYVNEEPTNSDFSKGTNNVAQELTTPQHPRTTPTPVGVGEDLSIKNTVDQEKNITIDYNGKGGKGMLSFTEWKKKLDEQTKEKEEVEDIVDVSKLVSQKNKTSTKKTNKIKKNYASLQCGAKVIDANPEASNSLAVLKEDKDLYMLNPCHVKAWFVVELCERIEVDSIDFANFEMFSSTPEMFVVSVSSRYPTREWQVAGNFTGKPEKKIHNYAFEERFYAKYLKLEVTKYFGKEHYCPLSLLRVYGLTEVEQIEDEEDLDHPHDDGHHYDENILHENTKEKEGSIFNTVVDLVSDMANKLSGKKTVDKTDRNSSDVVTLLPENTTHSDEEIDFISRCIQRTTIKSFRVSVNPVVDTWFDYTFRQQKCATYSVTRQKLYSRKRNSFKKVLPKKESLSNLEETSDIVNSKEINYDVPPLPIPPIDSSQNSQTVKDNSQISEPCLESSKNCKRQQEEENTNPQVVKQTIETFETDEQHDIATTYEHKTTTTCSKDDPPTINIRNVLKPTIQSSSEVATSQSTTTTDSIQPLQTDSPQIDTSVHQPLIVEAKQSTKETITSSVSFEKDVMEFKVDENSQGGSMVAETIVTQSNNNDKSVEGIHKETSLLPSPSSSLNQVEESLDSSSSVVSTPNLSDIPTTVDPLPRSTISAQIESDSHYIPVIQTSISEQSTESKTVIPIEQTEFESTITSESAGTTSSTIMKTTGLSGSKESIIVKLNAKVKALQANLTMSMMYLEEMSERYRSAVEEVDKRHEKKIFALDVNLKVHQDLISHQAALISNLTKQILHLSFKLQNLTEVTHEQHVRLTEKHYSWVLIEVVTLIFILVFCRRRPKERSTEQQQRRHSEPIISTPMSNGVTHAGSPNGILKRTRRTLSDTDCPVHRSRANSYEIETLGTEGHSYEEIVTTGPTKKKKRRKSKSLDKTSPEATPEHKVPESVEKKTGILFLAGNIVLSGIAGAFYGHNSTTEKPSRQADALIDDVTKRSITINKGLRKAKSIDLPTIDEVDTAEKRRNTKETFCNGTYGSVECKGGYKKQRNKLHKSINGGRFA